LSCHLEDEETGEEEAHTKLMNHSLFSQVSLFFPLFDLSAGRKKNFDLSAKHSFGFCGFVFVFRKKINTT